RQLLSGVDDPAVGRNGAFEADGGELFDEEVASLLGGGPGGRPQGGGGARPRRHGGGTPGCGAAHLDFDLGGVEPEHGGDGGGQHPPGAVSHVLGRGANTHPVGAGADGDLSFRVVALEPRPESDPHAATDAAAPGIPAAPPQFVVLHPVVHRLPERPVVPPAAQGDRVDPDGGGHLVDRPFQGEEGGRSAGSTEGGAGRGVGDGVVVEQRAGCARVNEAREERGDEAAGGGAGGGHRPHPEGGDVEVGRPGQRQLDVGPGPVAADGELFGAVEDHPDGTAGGPGEQGGGDRFDAEALLGPERTSDVFG